MPPVHLNPSSIPVPLGWKRLIQCGHVEYFTPDSCKLTNVEDVYRHILARGACKCGLKCPFKVEEVFNFDPTVATDTDGNPDQLFPLPSLPDGRTLTLEHVCRVGQRKGEHTSILEKNKESHEGKHTKGTKTPTKEAEKEVNVPIGNERNISRSSFLSTRENADLNASLLHEFSQGLARSNDVCLTDVQEKEPSIPIAQDGRHERHQQIPIPGHPLCLRELLSSKQFWRIKELLKECLFHLDSFLLSGSTSNGGVCTDTFMTELFAVYCRLVLLQATQGETSVADISIIRLSDEEDKNEEAFCEDLEEILAWCGKILSSVLNKSFSATENSRPKRKRKVALDAPESPHNSYTLQTTIIVLDFFSEVLLAGVFPLELRNPLSHMVASWMKSPYAPSLVQQIRKLLYQLADSWTENQMKVSSVFVDNEELLEGLLDTIRKETVTRGEEYCTKVLSEMRPVLTAAVDVSVRVYSLAVDPLYSCPPLVATITDSIVRDMEDQFRIDLSRQWPTSTDDLPGYAKRMTHFICKGGVTKRFFLSHLISIPSKPKTDLDCKSHSLMLLSVMFVVLSLITAESSLLVEDARYLLKETRTFLESLSEEHEESLSTVVDILKNGCQVLEDRASIALS